MAFAFFSRAVGIGSTRPDQRPTSSAIDRAPENIRRHPLLTVPRNPPPGTHDLEVARLTSVNLSLARTVSSSNRELDLLRQWKEADTTRIKDLEKRVRELESEAAGYKAEKEKEIRVLQAKLRLESSRRDQNTTVSSSWTTSAHQNGPQPLPHRYGPQPQPHRSGRRSPHRFGPVESSASRPPAAPSSPPADAPSDAQEIRHLRLQVERERTKTDELNSKLDKLRERQLETEAALIKARLGKKIALAPETGPELAELTKIEFAEMVASETNNSTEGDIHRAIRLMQECVRRDVKGERPMRRYSDQAVQVVTQAILELVQV